MYPLATDSSACRRGGYWRGSMSPAGIGSRSSARLERARMQREIDQVIKAMLEGFTGADLKVKMNARQEHKTERDAQLAATEAPVPLLHPNMAEVYRTKVQQLREGYVGCLVAPHPASLCQPTSVQTTIRYIGFISGRRTYGSSTSRKSRPCRTCRAPTRSWNG